MEWVLIIVLAVVLLLGFAFYRMATRRQDSSRSQMSDQMIDAPIYSSKFRHPDEKSNYMDKMK